MASVNEVTLIGNLGRDPEVRYTPDGAAICNFSIATTRQWKDGGSGEKREETEWHRIVLFGRTAEVAGEYLKKGRSVYIKGRLKTRKYTDKDGVERYTTEVVGEQMQMLGGREGGGGGGTSPEDDYDAGMSGGAPSHGGGGARSGGAKPARSQAPAPSFADMDDDIPF